LAIDGLEKVMRKFVLSAVLFFLFSFFGALHAQTFRGTILGIVSDTSGAPIPGAKVVVRNDETGLERNLETNSEGAYTAPELPIGHYSVTISKDGFQSSVTKGIELAVAGQVTANATLKPGGVTESVVVSEEGLPQVETTSDTLGDTLTTKEIKNLPINGRDYTKLIYLTPGVTGSPDQISDSPGSFGPFSMNGARGRSITLCSTART
jgi:hypothetical protein